MADCDMNGCGGGKTKTEDPWQTEYNKLKEDINAFLLKDTSYNADNHEYQGYVNRLRKLESELDVYAPDYDDKRTQIRQLSDRLNNWVYTH